MADGRLIRVRNYRDDPNGTAYLVAESDKAKAIALIAAKLPNAGEAIEDLGRVSDNLIKALSVEPGEFVPITGVRNVKQRQVYPGADPREE